MYILIIIWCLCGIAANIILWKSRAEMNVGDYAFNIILGPVVVTCLVMACIMKFMDREGDL